MGAAASNGPMDADSVRKCFDATDNYLIGRGKLEKPGMLEDGSTEKWGCDSLATYSIIGGKPERIQRAQEALASVRKAAASGDASLRVLDGSLGCVLGNTIGDALGAPLEFSPVRYGVQELTGLCHDEIWSRGGYNSFTLKAGQWTDDDSMALCIADSLIICNGFDGCDLRQRFRAWLEYGYNNAFGRDNDRNSRQSVGLGGNISESMGEWSRDGLPMTEAGNVFTSGNGSVMRNGAVPVWFRSDMQGGLDAAYRQSRTTHRGEEAAELCRLLTFLCIKFINGAGREVLDDVSEFTSPLYTVECLAKAQCEEAHEDNANPVFGGLERRRWNWKSPDFRYCEFRTEEDPGYVGSYAMDNVSMALHCLYSTSSFEEATLKAANLCGDSDSVAAVVGQLAGALYGASAIPEDWLARVQRWDAGTIAARALMLHDHEALSRDASLSDAACASALLLGQPVSS